jgi:hypothetical protein
VPTPVTPNREWSIPTVDGVWVGDRSEPLPEDLSSVDYRFEHYLLVGEEYIHETLISADDEPPEHWHWRAQ